MNRILCFLVVFSLYLSCGWIAGEDAAPRFLDLPARAGGEKDDDTEASDVITFYDTEFEGDAFFWCLDTSGSMGWGGEIETLKDETTGAIRQLSRRSQFGLVTFSSNTSIWSACPQEATALNREAAKEWIQGHGAAGWTCLEAAAIATLNLSSLASRPYKRILLLSDGKPNCFGADAREACLANITAANWQRIPIDCLYISSDLEGIEFMRELAARNYGNFYLIPHMEDGCPQD